MDQHLFVEWVDMRVERVGLACLRREACSNEAVENAGVVDAFVVRIAVEDKGDFGAHCRHMKQIQNSNFGFDFGSHDDECKSLLISQELASDLNPFVHVEFLMQ